MRTVMLSSDDPKVVFGPVFVAESALDRTRGLLCRSPLRDYEGMLIMKCNCVHTVGMRYPIDIIFLRRDGKILRITENLPPLRMTGCYKADMVLELLAGSTSKLQLTAGGNIFGFQKPT